MRKERVVIYDMQDTQTKIPAQSITWGNGLIGIHSDVVELASGKPQYVRRGALANLRLATYTKLPSYIFNRCGLPGYMAPEIISIKNH